MPGSLMYRVRQLDPDDGDLLLRRGSGGTRESEAIGNYLNIRQYLRIIYSAGRPPGTAGAPETEAADIEA